MTNDVINAISTVGFPVVMCGGFGYFLYIIINKLLSQIDKFGESLDKFNDTLIIMDKRIENIEVWWKPVINNWLKMRTME